MEPGPDDPSVLTLQDNHRSSDIWNGVECGPIFCRSHLKTLANFHVPNAVTDYINNTQFRGIGRLHCMILDVDLITALVERWRQETHTFHLPFGEVTVALEDVAIILGLRVSGHPIVGDTNQEWGNLCEELLGRRPPRGPLKGSKLRLTWIHQNFQNLPNNPDNETVLSYVRAYILYLIGAILFTDKSGDSVSLIYLPLLRDMDQFDNFSWGSGVLACLYHNLCSASKKGAKQIAGPLLLLQIWSWERISISRPVRVGVQDYFQPNVDPLACKWMDVDFRYKDHKLGLVVVRDLFDQMVEMQFIWQPYSRSVVQTLAPRCIQDRDEWLVIAPLICFEAVEWHYPNRCVRQFGWHQTIPDPCDTDTTLHSRTRKNDGPTDYSVLLVQQITRWNNRMDTRIEPGRRYRGLMSQADDYLQWFNSITRRVISPFCKEVGDDYDDHHYYYPTASDFQTLTQSSIFGYNTTTELINQMPNNANMEHMIMLEQMQAMHLNALKDTRQAHLVDYEEMVESNPSPPRYCFRQTQQRRQIGQSQEEEEQPESSRRRIGKSRRQN